MLTHPSEAAKSIYWHRELPPLAADVMGEHVIEASSGPVSSTFAHHDTLWDRCYAELMKTVEARLAQEIARLGGDCAHVLGEAVDARHDDARGQMWLRGRFTYVLYRLPKSQ